MPDGTQVMMACGDGMLCSGQLVDRSIQWDEYAITLIDARTLRLYNTVQDSVQ